MRVVREVLPNGLPFIFQAIAEDDWQLRSINIYPVVGGKVGKVLEPPPDKDDPLYVVAAARLGVISAENN
jgi:hypothetical protein